MQLLENLELGVWLSSVTGRDLPTFSDWRWGAGTREEEEVCGAASCPRGRRAEGTEPRTVLHSISLNLCRNPIRFLLPPPPELLRSQRKLRKAWVTGPRETVRGVPRWGVPRVPRLSYLPRSRPARSSLQPTPIPSQKLSVCSRGLLADSGKGHVCTFFSRELTVP